MFVLSESSDYDRIFWELLTFLKCSVCRLEPARLGKVCENAHFSCKECLECARLPNNCRCKLCKGAFAIRNLTVFNSIRDVLSEIPDGSVKFIDDLVQVLECPVCYEETITSLTICFRGHTVCKRCSEFTDTCPLCRDHFVLQRFVNKIKEKLEDVLLDIPCCNQAYGCQVFNDYNNVKSHIEKCSFIPWECEAQNCSWTGIGETTTDHAIESHQGLILKGKKVMMSLNLDESVHLQLWNRKKNIYYKIIYKMTGQGLKFVIFCQKATSEKVLFSLNYEKKALRLITLCVEPNKNPLYYLTHECPEAVIPSELVLNNRSRLECLLQIEEGRWRTVVILFIKVALMLIKLLTF